ncbi:carbohydrate ABC transporter permease [Bacillus sp. REN16]|uniref:carbohydrate ABC transporter permease n=1 Tax=Bacillus sp. REN16 TaxID=2887296 RepID=UPI001E557BD7|nr:carbohydrate ABC transporter permease [Bacillus sp. REN16]MCC3358943.1 carbohydrate ABC transporter permease [Bacillus sp. REN16]
MNKSKIGFNLLNYTLLSFFTFLMIIPIIWMVLTSLKPDQEVMELSIFGSSIEWGNYARAWSFFPFGRFMFNSFFVSLTGTFIVLITSTLAAYAFARLRFPGREKLFALYLCTLMIPQQVVVIPMFLIMNKLGWTNSYWALILPWAFTAFGAFLIKQFYGTIPRELDEAAIIDGCSHFSVYWRIHLPLLKPAIAALTVFTFLSYWNNILWPLIIIDDQNMWTLPLGLQMFKGQFGTEWNLLMAAATITTIPGILIFILAQRYIVQGISLSGLGGK